MNKVKFIQLDDAATEPKRATSGSAGYDICAIDDFFIEAGGSCIVPTGIAAEFDGNTAIFVQSRSGLAFNHEIVAFHGLIDSDYDKEIKVLLFNHSREGYIGENGDKIAQLVVQPVIIGDDVVDAERNGGFGSTGS